MIKRSAILLLFLALGSFSLLLYASYSSPMSTSAPANEAKPVKCSGSCKKKNIMPAPWNIVSPTMFHRG